MIKASLKKLVVLLTVSMLLSVAFAVNAADSGKVIYKDNNGGLIIETSSESAHTYITQDKVEKINPKYIWNSPQARNVKSSSYKGKGTEETEFINRPGFAENVLQYELSKSWTCELSVTGKFDVKVVESTIGVKIAKTYSVKKTYTIKVPANKNITLWVAPKGEKYTWDYYSPNITNGGYTKTGSGSYINYTSEVVNPVYW